VEALHQPEYVHVLINHLPLTGLFAALLCLIGSLALRKRAAAFLGTGLVSLFSLSVWPVYAYGEAGYDRVYSMADGDGDAYLHRHKELAKRWAWLFYLTSAAGALGLVVGWKRPNCLWVFAWSTVILATGSLVAGAAIADAGGKVRHPEFRNGQPPASHHKSALWFNRLPNSVSADMKRWDITCIRTVIVLEQRCR
jgi:hypothetical protein